MIDRSKGEIDDSIKNKNIIVEDSLSAKKDEVLIKDHPHMTKEAFVQPLRSKVNLPPEVKDIDDIKQTVSRPQESTAVRPKVKVVPGASQPQRSSFKSRSVHR